jgi:hypothetical protein
MLKRFSFAFALTLALAALAARDASAANRTSWTAGNGVGYTWTAVMGTGDMTSLAAGSTVLSTLSITNQTAQDQFADLSGVWTVISATPPAGAYIGVYLMPLNSDGTTYGTAEMASGATITRKPAAGLACSLPLETTVATTTLAGSCTEVVIPPGTFRIAVYNGSGAALSSTAGNNTLLYRSYNINLND